MMMLRILTCLFGLSFSMLNAQFAQFRVLHGISNGEAEQWKTVEIGISIPQQESSYRRFLEEHSRGINPYQQHNMWMQFSCNGKIYHTEVFYMEEGVPDETNNTYTSVPSAFPWRARFAVPDTGIWGVVLLVGEDLAHAAPQNTGLNFRCVKGNSKGYLRIAGDEQHFEYEDGSPYFIIGQNIAWTGAPILHGYMNKYPQYIEGYYDLYHYINDLADNGGNFFRIVMAPWSTAIENKTTGVYEQDKAAPLDSMLRIAEARGLHVQIALDFSLPFSAHPGPNEAHPYRASFLKPGMTASDLLNDSAALEAYESYFRYCYARWLNNPTVVNIELLCEMHGWEGYDEHKEYFDRFFVHMKKFLRENLCDKHHFLGTSVIEHDVIRMCSNAAVDYADNHTYRNNYKAAQMRYHLVQRSLRKCDKPFLFGEMGMINGPVNACDAGDFEQCTDISFHNSLWSTAFMGGLGAGLEWWAWGSETNRKNFPAVRYFIDSVAINMTWYPEHKMWTGNDLEVFYDVGYGAVGWVHNRSYWWANTRAADSCRDRNGNTMNPPLDDDRANAPKNVIGNSFTISGLERHFYYVVTFYDTHGEGRKTTSSILRSNYLGKIKLRMPENTDCSFSIKRAIRVDF